MVESPCVGGAGFDACRIVAAPGPVKQPQLTPPPALRGRRPGRGGRRRRSGHRAAGAGMVRECGLWGLAGSPMAVARDRGRAMSGLLQLSLIRFFGFYLAVMFLLGTLVRVRQYRTFLNLVRAMPG